MRSENDLGFIPRGVYEPIAKGDYDAVIHGIVSLGLNPVEFQGQKKEPSVYIKIIYELPSEVRDDGQTEVIGQRVKLSANDKSKCYEMLSTIKGKDFNKNDIIKYLNSDGLKQLLGKAVTLTINYFEKDGKNLAYVEKVHKLDPRLPQPVATRDVFFFNPLAPDLVLFENTFTYNTQSQVMNALNSGNFPPELHAAWAKIQEERETKQQPQNTSTEAIE